MTEIDNRFIELTGLYTFEQTVTILLEEYGLSVFSKWFEIYQVEEGLHGKRKQRTGRRTGRSVW